MATRLNNITYLKDTRKYLRKHMTEAELVLWSVLKGKKLGGRKFRRQHGIGFYIADFYCPSEKLIIELDGQHHYTAECIANDTERDEYFNQMNIKVLRFEKKEVLNDLTGVLRKIKANFNHQIP